MNYNRNHDRRTCQKKLKRKKGCPRCERCNRFAKLDVRFDAVDCLSWVVHKECENGHITEYWVDGRRWVGVRKLTSSGGFNPFSPDMTVGDFVRVAERQTHTGPERVLEKARKSCAGSNPASDFSESK